MKIALSTDTSGRGTVLDAEVGKGAAVLWLFSTRADGPDLAEFSCSSPPSGWRFARGSKRRSSYPLTGWRQHAGGAEQASMRLICRWKAPWVRRIVSFFAEGCLKRPWWATLAWFAAGELVKCVRLSDTPDGWHLLPAITTSLRQKVPERIGLGRSLRFERSRWRECIWHS
jgi:hypothetical protein